jgi:probable inactive protein kinase-like protein SgK071
MIAAMRHHSDDASVQDRGCCALHGFGNAAPDTCATIVRAGGIDVVLAAMRRFTGSAVVQQAGCLALLTLAVADSHKVAIARAGGIEAVVAAMRRYPEAYDTGCGALWLLAADPDIKAAVIRAGGCSVVVEAKRHGGGGSPSIDLAFKALSQ